MANLKNNTAKMQGILDAVNALPEAGGITPAGTRYIAENGTYDVTTYAKVNIQVPIPESSEGSVGDLTSLYPSYSVFDGGMILARFGIQFPDYGKSKEDIIGLYFYSFQGLYPQADKDTICGGFVDMVGGRAFIQLLQKNNRLYTSVKQGSDVLISSDKMEIVFAEHDNIYGYNPDSWYGQYIYKK